MAGAASAISASTTKLQTANQSLNDCAQRDKMSQNIAELTAKMQHGTRKPPPQGKKPSEWTDKENAVIREHYASGGANAVMVFVQRSRKAVNCQAAKLGITTSQRQFEWEWTKAQDQVVIENYTLRGGAYVAGVVKRSVYAVRRRAAVLGVKADKSLAARVRYEKLEKKPNPPKKPRHGPKMTVMQNYTKIKYAPMAGAPIITADTKVTIAPPFVDRRWLVEVAPNVVDSAQCGAWACAT